MNRIIYPLQPNYHNNIIESFNNFYLRLPALRPCISTSVPISFNKLIIYPRPKNVNNFLFITFFHIHILNYTRFISKIRNISYIHPIYLVIKIHPVSVNGDRKVDITITLRLRTSSFPIFFAII